jgi:hypothetical protein
METYKLGTLLPLLDYYQGFGQKDDKGSGWWCDRSRLDKICFG